MRLAVRISLGLMALVPLGLLVLGLVRARQLADETLCSKHLKVIGFALYDYHDQFGYFPQAATHSPDLSFEQRLSWMVDVQPTFGAADLGKRCNRAEPWDAPSNRYLAVFAHRGLRCPAFSEDPPSSTFAPTNYIGITGLGADSVYLPLPDRRAGFFSVERKLTSKDIPDGTSTLIAIVETARVSGAWSAAGTTTVRGLDDATPDFGRNGQFGGTHRRGTKVLFADGSRRFVRDSMNPQTFRSMATIHGRDDVETLVD